MATDTDVLVPTPNDLAAITELVWTSFVDGAIYPDSSERQPCADQVIASVAISGAWTGHVQIAATPAAARRIAAAMFAVPTEQTSDDDVTDAFGEIANVLGGNVKGLLPEPSVLSLPQVALDTRQVRMPSTVLRSCADLRWDGEPVTVSVWQGPTASDGGM